MARRTRRTTRTTARRSYSARPTTARYARSGTRRATTRRAGSRGASANTLRIVIEQPTANAVSRPDVELARAIKAGPQPKRARF